MMDEKEIMPYNFFKYGGVYTGEHHGMRYLIKNTGEKPDFKLMVQVWLGPYASIAVPDKKRQHSILKAVLKAAKKQLTGCMSSMKHAGVSGIRHPHCWMPYCRSNCMK